MTISLERHWVVETDAGTLSAALDHANPKPGAPLFLLAHGAGGHMSDRAMLAVSETLTGEGFPVVRFNFPYRQVGSGRPDRMPVLELCVAAVAHDVQSRLAPRRLILGGRSMGGRAASMVAAHGFACDGLLLLAYPLHPAGEPEKLRDGHLASIPVPVLCFNGTRDPLCERELMDRTIAGLPDWRMHWLEHADHGFHVTRASGGTDAQVLEEVGECTTRWIEEVIAPRG